MISEYLEGEIDVILYKKDKDGNLKIFYRYDTSSFIQAVGSLAYLDCLDEADKVVIERSFFNR